MRSRAISISRRPGEDQSVDRTAAPRASKLQRWTDLIAALLPRRYPATFEEIAPDVPAYCNDATQHGARMRMFERDKDELRSFGIAIETVAFDDGEAVGYRLDRKGFYLPYLSLAARGGKPGSMPKKQDRYGFRALASLVFEPDELAVIVEAAKRVVALGDPVLTEEAQSAMKKLSFDLPLPEPDATAEAPYMIAMSMPVESILMERAAPYSSPNTRSIPPPDVFTALNDALSRRKSVTFDYHGMATNSTARRTLEPYGLFFLSAHWYVAGRDTGKEDLRNFRLNRIRDIEVNPARSQTADYEIPAGFNIREHAKSRHAWEIGGGVHETAIVEFLNPAGAAKAAARLGVAVDGASDRRRFQFRRMDSFARWLLSFGGEAVPMEPPALVEEFERQVRDTRAVYVEERL